MTTNRRIFLLTAAAAATGAAAYSVFRPDGDATKGETFEFVLSDAEWRRRLDDRAYGVLRREATEPPYTSDLLEEKRAGLYLCAGCDLELYASETKFDSGTGWPSFYAALPNAVATRVDYKLLLPRTEVHCRRCGGHLGHVFDDGPPPTGKRHCINGVALKFRPKNAA